MHEVTMQEVTMEEVTMVELTAEEIHSVSGGATRAAPPLL
jgi:phage FluMu protein gp41